MDILAFFLILEESIQSLTIKYDVNCMFFIDALFQVEEVFFLGMDDKFHQMLFLHLNIYIFLINLFILFLAALGLRCCAWAFSSCGERGLFFVVVRGLLIAVVSLVVDHGL